VNSGGAEQIAQCDCATVVAEPVRPSWRTAATTTGSVDGGQTARQRHRFFKLGLRFGIRVSETKIRVSKTKIRVFRFF